MCLAMGYGQVQILHENGFGTQRPPKRNFGERSGRKNSSVYKRATFFGAGQWFESATFFRKVPKKVDWGHKKPCVSVRAWHEKNAKTGRARRSMWLIPHVRRPIDGAAHAGIPPRLSGYWNAQHYSAAWEKPPTWRVRDRGLVREIA